jgi:glyoxylase-like metal-dependent hydrolase (beta-lactamase superfamily II)
MKSNHPVALPADLRMIDDTHLGRPHVIATYLLLGDTPAVVDPGPASTLDTLSAGLGAFGLALGDLRAILLTHIHLDHAGATGELVRRYPHLRVYVHQRGARHLAAPEKLINSATRLYGDQMERLWGPIVPVPEQNISTLVGGETLQIGQRALRVFDAPGHASHHVAYFDEGNGAAFVGDTGGVCISDRMIPRAATPPPDIDVEAWMGTLDLLESLAPQALLLTHFGPAYEPAAYLDDYRATLRRWAEAVRVGLASGADEATQIERLRDVARADMGADVSASDIALFEQASSVELNYYGLARYWRKRAES